MIRELFGRELSGLGLLVERGSAPAARTVAYVGRSKRSPRRCRPPDHLVSYARHLHPYALGAGAHLHGPRHSVRPQQGCCLPRHPPLGRDQLGRGRDRRGRRHAARPPTHSRGDCAILAGRGVSEAEALHLRDDLEAAGCLASAAGPAQRALFASRSARSARAGSPAALKRIARFSRTSTLRGSSREASARS